MRTKWITLAALVLSVGCTNMNGKKKCDVCEKEDEKEVKMSLADVPAAVRDALKREAGGATIEDVDKETSDGKTVYETDVISGGKNWEIRVDEKGNVLSKKVEDESKEKKEKDDKEEKEDRK